jgi:hypothetical protein
MERGATPYPRFVRPRKQATAQRRIGYNGDAELPCSLEQTDVGLFNSNEERRILDLNSRDWVQRVENRDTT